MECDECRRAIIIGRHVVRDGHNRARADALQRTRLLGNRIRSHMYQLCGSICASHCPVYLLCDAILNLLIFGLIPSTSNLSRYSSTSPPPARTMNECRVAPTFYLAPWM